MSLQDKQYIINHLSVYINFAFTHMQFIELITKYFYNKSCLKKKRSLPRDNQIWIATN